MIERAHNSGRRIRQAVTLLGSKPADWDGVRRVVLEYHDVPGHGWAELEAFFAEAGLETVRHEPATAAQGNAWLRRSV